MQPAMQASSAAMCSAPGGCACELQCRRHQLQPSHQSRCLANQNASPITMFQSAVLLFMEASRKDSCWATLASLACTGECVCGGGGWGWGWGGGGGGGAAARQLVLGEACMSGAGERGECGERGGRKAVGLWMGRQLGNGSGPSREGGTGAAGAVCRGVQLPHQCCSSYRVGSG